MSPYETLLIVHIFGAFVLVGGHSIATIVGIKFSRTSSPQTALELAGLPRKAELLLAMAGNLETAMITAFLYLMVAKPGA